MKKYTVKELTQIQGMHDITNCDIPACSICREYHAYAMKLATQGEVMEQLNRGHTVQKIALNLCMSEDAVKNIITACASGQTATAIHMNQYQNTLAELVQQGFSIPAIAKILGKSTAAVSMYLKSYCMVEPDVKRIKIDKVKAVTGYRYFDQRGIEYTLTHKRGSD